MTSGRSWRMCAWTIAPLALLASSCGGAPPDQASEDPPDIAATPAPEPIPSPRLPCAVTGTRETAADCAEFASGLDGLKAGVDAFQPEQPMVRDEVTEVRYSLAALPESIQGDDGEIAAASDAPMASMDASAEDSADVGADAASDAASAGPSQSEIDEELARTEAEVSRNVAPEEQAASVEAGRIRIGQKMFACLAGDSIFEIKPVRCQTYNMIENPNPTWVWQVIPRAGDRAYKLYLTSGIELEGADGEPRRIGQFSKTEEISVEVTTLGRFQDKMRAAEAWIRTPMGVIAALTALIVALGGLGVAWRRARKGEAGPPAPSRPSSPT